MIVTVVSKSERGHRRAGRFWPSQPVTADVSEAQLAELKADPRLAVVDGSAPAAEAVVEKLAAEKKDEEVSSARATSEKRGRGSR
jgi:hypothetical protein